MSQKPLTMEQLKQVLQLKKDGIAIREIVRRTGISRNAVNPGMIKRREDSNIHMQYLFGSLGP
jgi:transcriptional regulator